MDKKKLNDKNQSLWIYLPDTHTLFSYLKHKDLIQLSMACRNYRAKLKSRILSKVKISEMGVILPTGVTVYFTQNNNNDMMINHLRNDFRNNHHLAKQVVFDIGVSNHIINYFFTIFPNIKIVIFGSGCGSISFKKLAKALHNLKYLEQVIIDCNFSISNNISEEVKYNFFSKLKKLELCVPSHFTNLSLPFDMIDSSFSNFQSLTIVNDHMLNYLSNSLPSLVHVELSRECIFDQTFLSKFIDNNLQLKKLTLSTKHLGQASIDTILNSKTIEHLSIRFSGGFSNTHSEIIKKNYSIKKLTIERSSYESNPIKILNACENIQTLEFINYFDISFWQIHWKTYTGKLNTIIFNSLHHLSILNSIIPNLNNSKEVKFINGIKHCTFMEYFKHINNGKFIPKQDYTLETDEFSLIMNQ